jgi:hypothetical protein
MTGISLSIRPVEEGGVVVVIVVVVTVVVQALKHRRTAS